MRGPGGRAHGGPVVSKVQDKKGTLIKIFSYARKYTPLILIAVLLTFTQAIIQVTITKRVGLLINEYIGNYKAMTDTAYLIIILALSMVTCMYFKNAIMSFVGNSTVRNARRDAFSKLQNLPVSYFDKNPAGRVVSSLTNDFDSMGQAVSEGFVNVLTSVVMIVANAVSLFIFVPFKLSFVTILVVPVLFIMFGKITKSIFKYFGQQQKSIADVNATVEESIYGLQAIKLYNQEQIVTDKFNVSNEQLKEAMYKSSVIGSIMGPLVTVFINFIYAIIVIVGVVYLIKDAGFGVGTITMATLYSSNLLNPIREVGQLIGTISAGLAGAERAFKVTKEASEYENDGSIEVTAIRGDIEFKDVIFSYVPDKKVLKNISFSVNAGEKIAIVGPTGSGKTTIINLLTKFYDIDSGEITIDGVNINELDKKSLRRKVGVVLQDNYLFSGTVKENIKYGKLDATDEEVVEAARKANADGFISRLPKGYDTDVQSGGENFSLGERQLISIARTLLNNPDLLILDEATSSVDTRTERYVIEAMETLSENRTSFVIAHRLQTIRDASRIMVIKDGELQEFGSHIELIESRGLYYDLYTTQFRDAN